MASEISAFIAITDRDWFECLSSAGELDEINFWQPSSRVAFSALRPGEPLPFKLHRPDDYETHALKWQRVGFTMRVCRPRVERERRWHKNHAAPLSRSSRYCSH